jgi:CHAD domain-containing protein
MEIARHLADAARSFTTPARAPERTYRLRTDEHVPDGIRRIARGQLQDARDELDATSPRRIGEAVHGTRKRLKRLRACVRLARDAIGEPTYERENTTLRMAGRRLSAQRDAEVLVQTLDAVADRFADELPGDTTSALRGRLDEERKAATAALADDDGTVAATRAAIDAALARTPAWTFQRDGLDALSPGLRRIYRRGRTAMRAARDEPTPEHLHEWRKRAKDLWYAAEIVQCAQPKRLERVARRAHKLSSVLGDHHDLDVLRAYVQAHPQCFAEAVHQQALVAVVDRRAARLRKKAFARGAKLYAQKPKRFVREVR